MSIALIFIVVTTLTLTFYLNNQTRLITESYPKAFILFSTMTLIFTETISLFGELNLISASIFWAIISISGLFYLIYNYNIKAFDLNFLRIEKEKLNYLSVAIILLVLISFGLSIISPPNNLDSHNYHLNRIVNWIQNENVLHFPTIFAPELYHNPMGEYLVLQTFLLSGSDKFANSIQFFALLGNLANIYQISGQAKLNYRTRYIAVFLMLTIPIALFESTTTQVDLLACFYFTSFVYHIFEWNNNCSKKSLIWACLSFTLGAFTKYTIFMYCLPFYLFIGISKLIKGRFKDLYCWFGFTISCLFMVYSFFWYRNYELFGNILSPIKGSKMYLERIPNERFGIDVFSVIALKNLVIHAALPVQKFNLIIDNLVYNFHQFVGIAVNDLRYSFNYYVTKFSMQEDMATNAFHFYLGIVALVYTTIKRNSNNYISLITGLALSGLLILSGVLKFELWVSRTQLPFFALLSIFIAVFLSQINLKVANAILLLQFIFSIILILTNPNKPVLNLKYDLKRYLSFVPTELIPDRTETNKFEPGLITNWYEKKEGIYHIKKTVTNSDSKNKIFRALEQSHYYDVERDNTIFNKTRNQLYFAPNYYEYYEIKSLFRNQLNEIKNIGVIYYSGQGFYKYWAYLNYGKNKSIKMQHILFPQELNNLQNTRKHFEYNYVFTDHLGLAKSKIPENSIEKILHSGKFYLIKLKKSQSDQYNY